MDLRWAGIVTDEAMLKEFRYIRNHGEKGSSSTRASHAAAVRGTIDSVRGGNGGGIGRGLTSIGGRNAASSNWVGVASSGSRVSASGGGGSVLLSLLVCTGECGESLLPLPVGPDSLARLLSVKGAFLAASSWATTSLSASEAGEDEIDVGSAAALSVVGLGELLGLIGMLRGGRGGGTGGTEGAVPL